MARHWLSTAQNQSQKTWEELIRSIPAKGNDNAHQQQDEDSVLLWVAPETFGSSVKAEISNNSRSSSEEKLWLQTSLQNEPNRNREKERESRR